MKTLIINNYFNAEKCFKVAEAIVNFSDYEVLRYNEDFETLTKAVADVDAIILTGSEARIVKKEHVKMFENIIKLVKNCTTPMLGICFGHQLICLSFGAEVTSLKAPIKNKFEKVKILKLDELFKSFKEGKFLWLAESHNDYVKRNSLEKVNLEVLAESRSCEVEAVKHRKKPFYGIQFHAEKIIIRSEIHSEGLKILKNFLDYAHK